MTQLIELFLDDFGNIERVLWQKPRNGKGKLWELLSVLSALFRAPDLAPQVFWYSYCAPWMGLRQSTSKSIFVHLAVTLLIMKF